MFIYKIAYTDLNSLFQIYNIYSPKAVHIGDENVVQTVNPKTVNDNKLDNEIAVKNQSQVVPNNNEEKMGKESGSDEEDRYGDQCILLPNYSLFKAKYSSIDIDMTLFMAGKICLICFNSYGEA